MKVVVAASLLVALAACGSGSSSDSDIPPPKNTEAGTLAQTCAEVQLGITTFNDEDYLATMEHFKRAEVYAKVHARKWGSPEAASLLQAVDYYAHLPAKVYPSAARSSDDFRRYTVAMLEQCGKDGADT
jgi:major membrane immunogen (membrane-anchored lipoprotein)